MFVGKVGVSFVFFGRISRLLCLAIVRRVILCVILRVGGHLCSLGDRRTSTCRVHGKGRFTSTAKR